MTVDPVFWRMVRIGWPMCGGAWGAWLVLRRLLGVSINGDSLAGVGVWMFGLFFVLIFFTVGAAIAALVGHLVHWLLRRSGAGVATAVTVATLAIVLAIWQAGELVQARSAGLRAPVAAKPKPGRTRSALPNQAFNPPSNQPAPRGGCQQPRPTDATGAAMWDAECR